MYSRVQKSETTFPTVSILCSHMNRSWIMDVLSRHKHYYKVRVGEFACITWPRKRHHIVISPEVTHATWRRTGSINQKHRTMASLWAAWRDTCVHTWPAIRHHRRLDNGPPVQRLFSGPSELSIVLPKYYITWFWALSLVLAGDLNRGDSSSTRPICRLANC